MKCIKVEASHEGNATTFLLDPAGESDLYTLHKAVNSEDSEVWRLLEGAATASCRIRVGNIVVIDLAGVGRAVSDGDSIVFQRSISKQAFEKIIRNRPVTCCPFCGSNEVREICTTLTDVLGEDMDLDEYQCHGKCEGRSFWV